jgi:hypothetical protein
VGPAGESWGEDTDSIHKRAQFSCLHPPQLARPWPSSSQSRLAISPVFPLPIPTSPLIPTPAVALLPFVDNHCLSLVTLERAVLTGEAQSPLIVRLSVVGKSSSSPVLPWGQRS